MAKKQQTMQGFTIIEVVLVLAIAGLIFLMVFVALPALQRSQRDTQRRNDMARVDTSLTQYQTNNQNTNGGTNLPKKGELVKDTKTLDCGTNSACSFVQRYMNAGDSSATTANEFQDPDGTYYGLKIGSFSGTDKIAGLKDGTNASGKANLSYSGTTMDHMIYIVTSAMCDGEAAVAGSARDYAVLYRLEGSGVYCIDNR